MYRAFPRWLSGTDSTYHAGDTGSITKSGRSPGKVNGNPLQYSCLGNPMDEELGGLQLMGSQKRAHNLATKQQQQRDVARKTERGIVFKESCWFPFIGSHTVSDSISSLWWQLCNRLEKQLERKAHRDNDNNGNSNPIHAYCHFFRQTCRAFIILFSVHHSILK